MFWKPLLELSFFFALLLVSVVPLGAYMARIFSGGRVFLTPLLSPLERFIYRLVGVGSDDEQTWKAYLSPSLPSIFLASSFSFSYSFFRRTCP